MKKLEKMIQKNLNLEVPLKYPKIHSKSVSIRYLKYCIPFMAILLFSIPYYKLNENTPLNTLATEDSITINTIYRDSTLDKAESSKDYIRMCEINKTENLLDMIPFLSAVTPHWILNYKEKEFTLFYHNHITLSISIGKEQSNWVIENFEKIDTSTISEIPIVINHFSDYYQAYFSYQEKYYFLRSFDIDENKFISIVKQFLNELQKSKEMDK